MCGVALRVWGGGTVGVWGSRVSTLGMCGGRVYMRGVCWEARWACMGYVGRQGGHPWGVRCTRGTQPWREASPQLRPSPQGLFSPSLQPEPLSSGFNPHRRKENQPWFVKPSLSSQGLSPFLPPHCWATPKNARSNVKPARGGLALLAPSEERLRGWGSDQAPPGRVFPPRTEETPQVHPGGGGGGGRRGGGEAEDKGRRHLHSPSVATLAGLQREVDAGAAGEG